MSSPSLPFTVVPPPPRPLRSHVPLACFWNNSFWSPRFHLVLIHAGGRADDPGRLLSCCFRVTLFRVKIRNEILTFALHRAVKTIQGRGCGRRSTPRVISGADDERFQWEALKRRRPQISHQHAGLRQAGKQGTFMSAVCYRSIIRRPELDKVMCLVQWVNEWFNMYKWRFIIWKECMGLWQQKNIYDIY